MKSLSLNSVFLLLCCIVGIRTTPLAAQNKNTLAAQAARKMQEARIDSMKTLFTALPKDSAIARANLLHKISLSYKSVNRDSALACLKQAHNLLTGLPLSQTTANITYQLAQTYFNDGNLVDALTHCEQALGQYTTLNLPHRIGNTHNTMAACYAYQGKATEAISHFRLTLSFWDSVAYMEDYASVLGNIGAVYAQMLGNNALAVQYFERCLKMLEKDTKTNPSEALGIAYMNIGSAMLNLKHNDDAKGYYAKALITYRSMNLPMEVARTSLLLSGLYTGDKQPEKAEQLYNDAASAIASLSPDYSLRVSQLLTEGALRRAQKRPKEAIEAHAKALAIAEQNGDLQLQADCLGEYALTYRSTYHWMKAKEYKRRAQALINQMNAPDVQENVEEIEHPAPKAKQ